MAKKKLLADKLRTPRTPKKPLDLAAVELVGEKKDVPTPSKRTTRSTDKAEHPVIKKKTPPKPISKKVEEKKEVEMHRTSFNFPFEIYEAMRLHSFKSRMTMTDYIISLIKKDLKMK